MSVADDGVAALRVEGEVTVPGEELLRIDDVYAAHSYGCAQYYSKPTLAVGGDPPLVYISNDHTENPPAVTRRHPGRGSSGELTASATGHATGRGGPKVGASGPGTARCGVVLLGRKTTSRSPGRRNTLPSKRFWRMPTGYLWVKEWSASESGIPDQWSVFSPEGRWLGILPFPPNPARAGQEVCGKSGHCDLLDGDRDYFVILRQDELGVERVEGYRIRRDRTGGVVTP